MKNVALNRREKVLLFLTGISLPLINLRIKLPVMSMSLFMLSLITLIFLNRNIIINNWKIYKSDFFVFLFLFITLASVFYSKNMVYGMTQWIKLLVVIILFILTRALFYKKSYYINIIMKYASISLALYLIYLIWTYIFVFNETFIGIETSFSTKTGKNSLALIVSFILPFILTFFFNNIQKYKLKYFNLLVTMSSIIGAILIQSRALYLLIIIYIFVILLNLKINLNVIKVLITLSIVIIILFYTLIPPQVKSDLITRIESIIVLVDDEHEFDENRTNTGEGSIELRKLLVERGLNMFYEKPIKGHGLGSYKYYDGMPSAVSHNDYIKVAAEQGLIGITVFIMIICTYIGKSYFNYYRNKKILWVFLSMIGISFYFFMINAYDNIIIWFLLAIIDAYIGIHNNSTNFYKVL